MKEVQKSTHRENLNLLVYEFIKRGYRPSKICEALKIKKTALQYYLSSLKKAKLIKKIGYGVWEITGNFDQKKFKKTTRVAPVNPAKNLNLFEPNKIRGHAFQFTVKLPKIRNWHRRREFLQKKVINFKPLKIFGQGESIEFRGRKVWLTDKSVIIFEKSSYIANSAQESKDHAIYDLLTLLRGIERLLSANFHINGNYIFKVSKAHYSLIKNALAKQYDREGKKLEVYNHAGLWFLIDNSFNLHEAETVHSKTAQKDMDDRVVPFFNSLKDKPITTDEIYENFWELQSMMKTSSENQIMLSQVLQQMENNVARIVKKLGERGDEY